MDNALEEAQQPGTLLTIAGGVMIVFYGLYALMSALGLLFTCMGSGFAVLAMMDDTTSGVIQLGWSGWVLVFQLVGLAVYAGLAFAGWKVFQGGSALKELRELDRVKSSMMLAAAGPVVGLIANFGISLFTFSLCGIVTYTVPQLVVLLIGVAAAYMVNQLLQNESVVASFTE